jgi:hypothetical protein
MTNVDIKQMLFDQRMKEIEDDLPPFGIIDDGTEYASTTDLSDPYSMDWTNYEPDGW